MHVAAIRNYSSSMFAGTQRPQPSSRSLCPASRTSMADPPHPWHPYTGSHQVLEKTSCGFPQNPPPLSLCQRRPPKTAVLFLLIQWLPLKTTVLLLKSAASSEDRCLINTVASPEDHCFIVKVSGFLRRPLSYLYSGFP